MENTRINIDVLVEEYNKRSSDKLKDEYLKSKVLIDNYVTYANKMLFADSILKNCYFNGDKIQINSCNKYLLYIYALLKYWTNIDINEKDLMNQYDLLDKNGLIEKLIGLIPEKEVASFSTILEMKENDILANKCNVNITMHNKIIDYAPKMLYGLESLFGVIEERFTKENIENIIKSFSKKR